MTPLSTPSFLRALRDRRSFARPRTCTRVAWIALAASLTLSSRAFAEEAPTRDQPADASRALFAEGRKLAQAGQYAEACAKFEDSLKLKVGIGAQFNLADCYEHIGRTATARSLFLGVAASAHAVGQTEREQLARERASGLEPRLSRLLISVSGDTDGLVVRRNHQTIPRENYGAEEAVDPGKFSIEAAAPGRKPWSVEVEVPPLTTKPIEVKVPELEKVASEPVAPEPAANATEQSPPAPAVAPEEPPVAAPVRSTRRKAFALSLAAAGTGGLVAGIVLGLDYKKQNDRAGQICPTSLDCTAHQIEVHGAKVQNAQMFRTWSLVSFAAGGAALAGAAYLFFGPLPQAAPTQRAWNLSPLFATNGSWGAALDGRF